MGSEVFDREAAAIAAQLPAGPRLGIIGSASFWHPESEAICSALGCLLGDLDGLVLLTGGVEGVGEAVGRSFFRARAGSGDHRGVFHVLPRGYSRWDYGETMFAGSHFGERREVLGRLADIYVAIEGGPGTAHEASVALARSVLVIPVGRSGGYSGELYSQMVRPPSASEEAWRALGRAHTSRGQIAVAVTNIVDMHLRESQHGV